MSMYFDGYYEARRKVLQFSLEELYKLLDDLFGRGELEDGADIETVRAEALRQLQIEWTDTDSEDYKTVQFWVGVHKASGGN